MVGLSRIHHSGVDCTRCRSENRQRNCCSAFLCGIDCRCRSRSNEGKHFDPEDSCCATGCWEILCVVSFGRRHRSGADCKSRTESPCPEMLRTAWRRRKPDKYGTCDTANKSFVPDGAGCASGFSRKHLVASFRYIPRRGTRSCCAGMLCTSRH